MARVTYPKALKDLAAVQVRVVNPDAVLDYLAAHRDLRPLVVAVAGDVRSELPGVPLLLELVCDPDEPSAETLVLFIRPTSVEERFFDLLDRENARIAERLRSSQGWFLVTLDLRAEA